MLVSRAVPEQSKNRKPDQAHRLGSIWTRRSPEGDRQPLSRSQIVRAAVELADVHGLAAVSTRRIAARLGAGATSLSWHVGSRDDLYELMFDAVLGEVELRTPSGDWKADLRAIARASHDVFRRHPWLVLLGIQPSLGPNTRRYGELGMKVLAEYGLDRHARTQVLALLNNYVTGFAHRQVAWDQLRQRAGLNDENWENELQRYLDNARGDDPDLAADIESRLHLTSVESFELGLDCLIDGISSKFILHGVDAKPRRAGASRAATRGNAPP
jgi:AcrR family transcriptional regulator